METEEQRNERHLQWLMSDDNFPRLARESKRLYKAAGRGFWHLQWEESHHQAAVCYIRQKDIVTLPAGKNRDHLDRCVCEYDPACQLVIVIQDYDGITTHKMTFAKADSIGSA
jgi:hypothetical protein